MWRQNVFKKRVVRYDKGGDNHYDTISAFIKSMRDLIPMLQCIIWQKCCMQEKISNYARRISDLCSKRMWEMQNPVALTVAVSAAQAVGADRDARRHRLFTSQAVLYVATAPKSNSDGQ